MLTYRTKAPWLLDTALDRSQLDAGEDTKMQQVHVDSHACCHNTETAQQQKYSSIVTYKWTI